MPINRSASLVDVKFQHYAQATGLLYVISGNQVLRWNAGTGTFDTPLVFGGELAGVSASVDGRYLVVGQVGATLAPGGGYIATVHRIDTLTGVMEAVRVPTTSPAGVRDVVVAATGEVLVYVFSEDSLMRFDIGEVSPLVTPFSGLDPGVLEMVASPNQRMVLMLGTSGGWGPVHRFDSQNYSLTYAMLEGRGSGIDRADITDGGRVAILAGGVIQILNSQLQVVADLSYLQVDQRLTDIQFSRDGNLLLLWNSDTDAIDVYHAYTYQKLAEFPTGFPIDQVLNSGSSGRMDLVDNDTLLVLTGTNGATRIIDLAATLNLAMTGTAGNDTLSGLGSRDTMLGGDGVDNLSSSAGEDVIDGGGGNSDHVLFDQSPGGVTANLLTGIVSNDGFGYADVISGIENVIGSMFDDHLTGDNLSNQLTGLNGADVIYGMGGGDFLYGGIGALNDLYGGTGNDSYQLAVADRIFELAGEGVDTVRTSTLSTFALPDNVENLTYSGSGPFRAVGNVQDNVLTTAGGADVLTGGEGNDTLSGGAGNDLLDGGNGVDTALYTGAGSGVTVRLDLGQATGGHGNDTLTGVENVTGSAHADALTGDGGTNDLRGGGGADTLSGLGGNDALRGSGGNDTLIGGSGVDAADYAAAASGVTASLAAGVASSDGDGGSDTLAEIENLTGSAFSDSLTGNTADNVLSGGAGADTLIGGAGNDSLNGGLGIDLANYAAATGGVTVNLLTGSASNDGDGGADTLTGIEDLTGSALADSLTGDTAANGLNGGAGNDALNGGDGDDVLRGGVGVDVLTGGLGIDTADYSTAAAAMRAQLNTNVSSNDGDGGTDTFSGIENLTGSAFNDVLIGDGIANVLRGGTGADTLVGLAGNDTLWGGSGAVNTLQGGLGDDTYVLEAADSIVEFVGEGTDTVDARINTYVLANNVENLLFGGTGNFAGTGNALANVITGGAGADTLRGRGGVDVLNGGLGIDTADYTLAAAGVVARIDQQRATDDGDGATDTFTGIENLIGSNFNDTLIGDGNANVLKGGIGTDTLLGFGGNDVLWGGSGGGNNQMQGGTGDDWYVLDAFDTCVEFVGEGIDTVEARIGSYTMGANIENLIYTGPGKFVGNGNTLDNVITGGNQDDILRGRGGNDTINGGAGTDEVQLRGVSANYTVIQIGATWQIVDSVGGRDGTTTVTSIERLRFSDNTTRVLTYPAPGALEPVDKSAGSEPQVLPGISDDDFLPLSKDGDLPLVLPAVGDPFADLFGGPERLSLERGSDSPWRMLTHDADDAPDPTHDGVVGALDRSGWNHDTWSF